MKDITDLCNRAHATAKEKGWWDNPPSDLEVHALIHSEIAEATEAVRVRREWDVVDGKPEGQLAELADVVIRIADLCAAKGWDLGMALRLKMDYNDTRPFKHGGKEK